MKNKKNILAFFASIGFVSFTQAQQFKLEGHIANIENSAVHLYYENDKGVNINDSTTLKDGIFSFTGNVASPTLAYLGVGSSTQMNNKNFVSFFIEPGKITLQGKAGEIGSAVVSGSKTQEEFATLNAEKNKIRKRWQTVMDTLNAVNERSNTEFQKLKSWVLTPLDAATHEIDSLFFASHPQSVVTAYELSMFIGLMPLDTLEMYYNKLGTATQNTSFGRDIKKGIDRLKAGSPGSMAANFSTTDINGKPISLSDFKGKYVILDFWASWCVPCRASNPHMIALYKKYHDKGLEIIGVSDDDGKPEAWRKAVAKDGVGIWHNVLRGFNIALLEENKPNDKDISDKYGINSLPTKIIIDQEGKIIARYEGDDTGIDKVLQDIFKF